MPRKIGTINIVVNSDVEFVDACGKGTLCEFINCPIDPVTEYSLDCSACPANDETGKYYTKDEAEKELKKQIKKINKRFAG